MATTNLHNEAELLTCRTCGRDYIVRKCEVQCAHTDSYLNYCVPCQKAFHLDCIVTGPKKLGCSGASYLYPVLIRLGVLRDAKTGKNADRHTE